MCWLFVDVEFSKIGGVELSGSFFTFRFCCRGGEVVCGLSKSDLYISDLFSDNGVGVGRCRLVVVGGEVVLKERKSKL